LTALGVHARDELEYLAFDNVLQLDDHGRLLLVLESQPVLVQSDRLLVESHEYRLVELLPLHALLPHVAVLARRAPRCTPAPLLVLLLAHLGRLDDLAVVENGCVYSLDGQRLSLSEIQVLLSPALVLLQQVLKHQNLLLLETPRSLPVKHHVLLQITDELDMRRPLLSLENLQREKRLTHESVTETVYTVAITILKEQFNDVPILQLF
jgi:hypothetical protein